MQRQKTTCSPGGWRRSKRPSLSPSRRNKKKTPEAPKNWRAEERHTTYKFAKVYSDPETALDCIILDMHAHGARLKLLGAPELPNIVVLVAPGIGLRAKSKVVWQNGEEAGLNFVNKGSSGEEPR